MTYPVGSRPSVTATFTDAAGAAYDPSDVTFRFVDPDGAETTLTYLGAGVTKDDVGVYSIDIDTTDKPGRWTVRAFSPQGSGQAATLDLAFVITDTVL